VGLPDGLPVLDVGHVQARPDDVLDARTRFVQRAGDVFERLSRLLARVAPTDEFTRRVGRRGPRDVDVGPDADGPRVPDRRFPLGARRDVLSVHTDSRS
jgi:hypothetical protein